MKCAAMACKRKVRATPWDVPPEDGSKKHHLCYKHGWWYSVTHPTQYQFLCTTEFPLWSAGDIAVWLAWCGL